MGSSSWSNEVEEYDVDALVHESDEAWLFQIDNEEVWLPKSQCEYCEEMGTVDVPNWLAEAKGLL